VFIEKWGEMLDYFQYYQDGAQKRQQQGVIRSNCFQSVERTNIVQSRIGLRILKKQLSHHKIDIATQTNNNKTLLDNFIELWNSNGNNLAVQYTNTDTTQGMLKSITNGLKSLINNVGDTEKQLYLDVLLGKGTRCKCSLK
jgi:hypothetical protein